METLPLTNLGGGDLGAFRARGWRNSLTLMATKRPGTSVNSCCTGSALHNARRQKDHSSGGSGVKHF
eukprot:6106634-Amphidinium_carterae.1